MEEMSDKRPPPSLSIEFSEPEYSRLRKLNAQLEQAEQWIDRRSREMVTAYSIAAGQARRAERLDEDVELVATVLFLLSDGHADFVPGSTNIVTRIDIPVLPAARVRGPVSHTDARTPPLFRNRPAKWCSLFLNLYERALRGDAAKLLSIGALCIDVALIQQQMRRW